MSTEVTAVEPQIPAVKPMSGMAIAGFVLSLVGISIVGLVLSAVALGPTKKTHSGRGLAIAGVIVGVLGTIAWIVLIVLAVAAGESVEAYNNCVDAAQTLDQMASC